MKQSETYKSLNKAFYKHNYFDFIVCIITSFLTGFTMLILSYFLGEILDAATATDADRLLKLLYMAIIFFAVITAVSALSWFTQARFCRRAVVQYRATAFKGIAAKGISAFSRESTGAYISMLTNDVTSIDGNYLIPIFDLINQIVMFVGAIVMMFVYSPILAATALGFSLLPIVVTVPLTSVLAGKERVLSDKNQFFVGRVKDILSGFAVLKSFRAEREAGKLFNANSRDAAQAQFSRRWWGYVLHLLSQLCGVIMQFGVFFIGAYLAIKGQITAGTVILFVNLCNCIISPIQTVPQYIGGISAARSLVKKLADTIDENVERAGERVEPTLSDGIELKDLTFGYEPDKPVLKHISLKIEAGKKYAFVGNSGSGKSTLLNLLMGAWDNYSGSATIDGKEISAIDPDSLYDLESLIGQNVFLFDDTILNNITMYGSFENEAVEAAAARSGLGALIAQKGKDYACGENGVNLSGGERQRVSIARCLLRNTPVLLLDEATAALDNKTAFEIVDAILKLDNLTRIIVTHRLEKELLEQYDKIFVLWNGQVCESGTFGELMDGKGRFYSLYTLSE